MSDFWRLIALTYKQYSNVLGSVDFVHYLPSVFSRCRYEIINEPWAGNYLTDPTLLLPGVAGAINLQPFYDKMAKAIRSVDNETLIFYEPVTWGGR
jgi:endoglycosylceramidase